MLNQQGFTLFELMIAIAIIAILAAIGVPAYQSYIQKAAMTDMLQTMVPYKTAVELCVLEQNSLGQCNQGSHGITASRTTHYVSSVTVTLGVITLIGQGSLNGLTAKITPAINADGAIAWSKTCQTAPTNTSLEEACNTIFRF